ncbi:serine/threonine protein kinase [Nostoc sp. CENA543]|uniref:ATP-binding protein n=1 Tax=Nostoc sp. CENA543 TaxID=1869241 RepID=UPI000CA09E95|nr:anti-sigma regulatory factor [Nostoc sp. CENA543]AUT01470.1 serine/threonine protein kinase [Nostoc sp. CENA543]
MKLTKPDVLIHDSILQLASDLDAISTIVEWFEQFNHTPVTHQLWLEAQTAVIEGFTNAVRHAHCYLNPETPVDINVQISEELFHVCIWDQGDIFDFELALENFHREVSDRAFNPLVHESHWGCIFLLKLRKEYGWTISYTRESGDRNCLSLKKPLIN